MDFGYRRSSYVVFVENMNYESDTCNIQSFVFYHDIYLWLD